jgi:hypothetical protein
MDTLRRKEDARETQGDGVRKNRDWTATGR